MSARIIALHKPFKSTLAVEQKITLMKMFKVEFPSIKKMVITNSFHYQQSGMRLFTANFMPSIKYYNQHIEYEFKKKRATTNDESSKACGIEVTFDDNSKHYVDGENLNTSAIWKKLVKEAKGLDLTKFPERPAPPTLQPPTLDERN